LGLSDEVDGRTGREKKRRRRPCWERGARSLEFVREAAFSLAVVDQNVFLIHIEIATRAEGNVNALIGLLRLFPLLLLALASCFNSSETFNCSRTSKISGQRPRIPRVNDFARQRKAFRCRGAKTSILIPSREEAVEQLEAVEVDDGSGLEGEGLSIKRGAGENPTKPQKEKRTKGGKGRTWQSSVTRITNSPASCLHRKQVLV
jgi:hypothetical protein